MIILCAFRKLLKNTDTLFCDAFLKYLQKHVVDVLNRTPVSHVTSTITFFEIYTSTPAIAKTYMVTVCYVDSSMKQNFEQKNTTFPEFLMNVVDVTVSD